MDRTSQGLDRFVEAQAKVYSNVIDELALGHKQTHWMWFIFPQRKELGKSAMAKHYGLGSAQEARDYLAHPLLGQRLLDCTRLILSLRNADAHEIFGSPDDLKLRSCMTLFATVAPEHAVFKQALDSLFAGKPDQATLDLLTVS
jgi:uncharacterized protein (DUF1810 family)